MLGMLPLLFCVLALVENLVAADEGARQCVAGDCAKPERVPGKKKLSLWATPVHILTPDLKDVESFNDKLASYVIKLLGELEARDGAVGGGLSTGGASAAGLNERLFAFQRDNFNRAASAGGESVDPSYAALAGAPEVKHLVKLFDGFAKVFLRDAGASKAEIKAKWGQQGRDGGPKLKTFFWASVARGGGAHLPHTHPDASVSGVYYVRVPVGAGSLLLEDPRGGSRPPFDNRLIHEPEEGQMLLFPPWLLHHVSGTQGEHLRISFSFNAPGEWGDTADFNTERELVAKRKPE